jgi:hypothetical protein
MEYLFDPNFWKFIWEDLKGNPSSLILWAGIFSLIINLLIGYIYLHAPSRKRRDDE